MKGNVRSLEVLVFGRSGFIGSFVFKATKISIGRDADAMVRLDDPQVSLKHAELSLEAGFFRIKDLSSRTGTRVNGAPVLPRQPLEPTDEVSIGPFRLRATVCEPEPESVPAPSAPMAAAPETIPPAPPSFTEEEHTTSRHHRTALPSETTILDRRGAADNPASPTAPPQFQPPAKSVAVAPPTESTLVMKAPAAPRSTESTLVMKAPDPSAVTDTTVVTKAPEAPEGPESETLTTTLEAPTQTETTVVTRAQLPPPPSREAAKPARTVDPPPSRAVPPPAVTREASPPRDLGKLITEVISSATVLAAAPVVVTPPPAAIAASIAQPPRHALTAADHWDVEDDEDEDDDEDFVPSFDLLAALSRAALREVNPANRDGVALEVVRYRGDRVITVRHPTREGSLQLVGAAVAVGSFDAAGAFAVYPDAVRALSVCEGDRTLSDSELTAKREGAKVRLTPGMQATVKLDGEDRALLHWVRRAPELLPPPVSLKPTADGMGTGALSFVVHVAIMAFVGLILLGDKKTGDLDINAGRFAKIDIKELELETPPPPPPAPPPEAATADRAPTMNLAPATRQDRTAIKSKVPVAARDVQAQAQAAASNASAQRLLSALGGAPSALGAIAVTNLDALPVGAGDFKVSGTVGKAPGDTLRIAAAGSGGGDVNTKSASELGGANLGRVEAHAGTGAVRARVTAAPQSIRGEGHLDRGEIQKVVNAHLYQVQGCYERQLAKDPSLSGKVSYDWTVEASGGVSNVRVGRSTVHSVEVTTCIQTAIQGWKFPTPQGGSVTVTYPFAFSSLGS